MFRIRLFVFSFVILTIAMDGMEHPTSDAPSTQDIKNKIDEVNRVDRQIKANFQAIISGQELQNEMLFLRPQNPDQEYTEALIEHNEAILNLIDATKQQLPISQANINALLQQLGKLTNEPFLTTSIPSIRPEEITPTVLEQKYIILEEYLRQLTNLQPTHTHYGSIKLFALQIEFYAATIYAIADSILNTWTKRQNNIAIRIIQGI